MRQLAGGVRDAVRRRDDLRVRKLFGDRGIARRKPSHSPGSAQLIERALQHRVRSPRRRHGDDQYDASSRRQTWCSAAWSRKRMLGDRAADYQQVVPGLPGSCIKSVRRRTSTMISPGAIGRPFDSSNSRVSSISWMRAAISLASRICGESLPTRSMGGVQGSGLSGGRGASAARPRRCRHPQPICLMDDLFRLQRDAAHHFGIFEGRIDGCQHGAGGAERCLQLDRSPVVPSTGHALPVPVPAGEEGGRIGALEAEDRLLDVADGEDVRRARRERPRRRRTPR